MYIPNEQRKGTGFLFLMLNFDVKLWDLTFLDKNSSKFKDQISLTQRFMNQAASYPENGTELCQAVEKEMFLKVEKG